MYEDNESYFNVPLQQVEALGLMGLDFADVCNPQVSSLLLDKETIQLINNIYGDYHGKSAQSH